MNQAGSQFLAAAVFSRDQYRRAHLRQQFRLGAQFAHGGTGGHEEHVVPDLLNFVGHDFALGALAVRERVNAGSRSRSCCGCSGRTRNPVPPDEWLRACDRGFVGSSPAPAPEDRGGPGAASAGCASHRSRPAIRSSRIRSGPGPELDPLQGFPAAAGGVQLPAVAFTAGPRQIEGRPVLAHQQNLC